MSHSDQTGQRADEALDDATVEQLLAGRYEGDAPDLVAVSELLAEVRSLAERPAPLPSASLAQLLSDAAPPSGGNLRTTGGRAPRGRHAAPFRRRRQRPQPTTAAPRRSGPSYPPIAAVAAVAVLAAVIVGAGFARLLPGPTHAVVARIVRTMTPFDLPERGKPESVSSKPPTPETVSPSEEPAARIPGDAGQPGAGESERNGSRETRGDGPSSPSQPRDVDAPSTPATTVAEAGQPPGGATNSVPSPPSKPHRFTAELIGVAGAEAAGDLDGGGKAGLDAHPGRDELCLTLVVSGLAPVTAVHLHAQSPAASGPVVAGWTQPTAGAFAGCVPVADQLIKDIRKQPARYYVDVHTTEFPNGAVRGALTK